MISTAYLNATGVFSYTRASMSGTWRPALVVSNLLLLSLIAYFGARIVSATIAARLERPVATVAPAAPPSQAAPPVLPASAYAVIYERDVFNAVKGHAPSAAGDDVKRTDLNVKLWGTAVLHDPAQSFAIIEDQAKKRQALYRVGDTILDSATLARVDWDKVVLDRDGEEEILELSSARGPSGAQAAASASAERIRKTADNKFVIDRREVDKTLENLNQVYTQARAVPFFENGKTVGFRVFAIKPGSVFEKIGLQNGDIIRKVNGVEITDPTKALSLFTELQNEGHVALDLERNKQAKSFSYEIR